MITVASISLTVVTLLASLTFVALSFANATVGPRQLRAFLRDRITQYTIAAFLGSCVYCLVGLLFYRGGDESLSPHLGAFVALLFALTSTGLFIAYLHTLTRAVQPNFVIVRIVRELQHSIECYGQARSAHSKGATLSNAAADVIVAALPEPSEIVTAIRSGYVQQIVHDPLVEVVARNDCVVRFKVRPGHFVLAGEPIADAWQINDEVRAAIETHFDVGDYRTLAQDLEFGIDQLVEIAIRALSPAINDTFTALACVDWLGEAVRQFATSDAGTPVHLDGFGVVRIIDRPLRFESVVTASFAKVRQAGVSNPAVLIRLLEAYGRLAVHCTEGQRVPLRLEADAAMNLSGSVAISAIDRSAILDRADATREALSSAPLN